MIYRVTVKPLRRIYRFPIIFIALPVLVACGGTWDLRSDVSASKADITDSQMAIVEQHPTRRSPKIKTFRHFDLGIYKESAGSRHNDAYARSRVQTPPGIIQIGTTFPGFPRIYYPEIEFTADPKHTYYLTWACIPYPFLAIADAQSETIVAMDSYCPDCNGLVGRPLSPRTECSNRFQPPWMKPKEKPDVLLWPVELDMQRYRNLCYAAEHGIIAAMMRMGELYWIGMYGVKEDPVRAYIWYRLAKDTGDAEAIRKVKNLKNNALSANQLQQAERLFQAWQAGQCEKDLQTMSDYFSEFGGSEPKYKLEVND
jgi:hypothetical protein